MVAFKVVRGIKKYREAAKIEIGVLEKLAKKDRNGTRSRDCRLRCSNVGAILTAIAIVLLEMLLGNESWSEKKFIPGLLGGKYLKKDKEDDKIKSEYKSSWKNEHKGEAKGEGSSSKEFHCDHCKTRGHISDYCWKLHPELRPKEEKSKKERYALATEVVDLLVVEFVLANLLYSFDWELAGGRKMEELDE
ncbi:hypothetical protein GIB67_030974 [Kingdonia uniflora]|uniref:Uncharacterized protein n=1 Tax=Kingdonia uniflora TaxID=39325 RepID=A0A7J7L3J6_9MAGN|nr:hypothetical protein GIB67_030974 [Kingdonia uniflora]